MKSKRAVLAGAVGLIMPPMVMAHEGHSDTLLHALLHLVTGNPVAGLIAGVAIVVVLGVLIHELRKRGR